MRVSCVSSGAMEEELRCPHCKRHYVDPVLLPCYHALCLRCAELLVVPASATAPPDNTGPAAENSSVASSGSGADYQVFIVGLF